MTSRSIWRSALLISFALGCTRGPVDGPRTPQTADLLLTNADVFGAPGGAHANAIAIKDGQIVGFGTSFDAKRVVDLNGASVIIGLTDAHCHLYGLGLDIETVSVRQLDSEAAVVKVVADAARQLPAPRAKRDENDPGGEAEWLVGRGWDQNRWPGAQFPTKASLDAAVSDRPVLLRRVDGHAIWVNSQALAAAKITKATPDPAGGKIVRDAKGEPTGVFIDNAIDLVEVAMPAASAEARERRILAAAKIAVENGFTSVHEMGIDHATAEVYRRLATERRLPLRVHAYLAGDASKSDALRAQGPQRGVDRFDMKGVKFFVDGALGSRGARLYTDYDDDKGNRGLWVTEPAALTKAVDDAVAGGWQTAIHAIGDAGIGTVLDAYEAANAKHPGDRRLRIEHLQVFAPKDLPRIIATRTVASMQPTHATSDMPWAEKRVGAERIKGAYAWRTVLDNKIPLAFGSDFPVEEVSPLLGLHAAVTRQDGKGQPPNGWYPAQRMTLDEAVAGFSSGAAYAAFDEANWSKRADVTIFDGKLTEQNLLERRVATTIVGGEVVYGELR